MLLKQSTRDWVAYKQQKCISHSSGSGEVQGQRAGRVTFWWYPSLYPYKAESRGEACSVVSFIRALIPLMRALP